jgi:FkbM family methyltransferase
MSSFFESKFYHETLSVFSTTFKTIVRNIKGVKFEPEVAVLHRFVDKGDTCIDVGGAYGRYALPLSRLVGPKGKIYSFEPGQYSYKVFKSIASFHGMRNVVLIKKALSDKEGEIKLLSPIKGSGKLGASLSYIGKEAQVNTISETVAMTTIDIFCKQENIRKVNFIKCDTEGAELSVYRGAVEVIERDHPTVLSEVEEGNLKRYGHTKEDLIAFFLSRNYRIFILDKGAIKEVKQMNEEGNNYFFVHTSNLNRVK